MYYILDKRFRLRGWMNKRFGVYDAEKKMVRFIDGPLFLMLMKCDGAHDIDVESLEQYTRKFMTVLEKEGVIRKAGFLEFLRPEQEYILYHTEYKKDVQWSITGACNLKCRHCFMSAPHAKHGIPTHEQIIKIADSLAECGIFEVGLTGGEPLTRDDFTEIVSALSERGIRIKRIYTNGWLLDGKLLDEIEKQGQHPSFQISFDGIGHHDFLRGVPGAEEKTLQALKLLRERGYDVEVSLCLHRENKDTIRETIKLLASLGVSGVKIGSMMQLGEWAQPEVAELQLSTREGLEIFEQYIPQYFEDDAPLDIMLGGAFMYSPGDDKWRILFRTECSAEEENEKPSCGVLLEHFYIGADGMVAPCMGMADCGYAKYLPNLFQTPLAVILEPGSDFNKLCRTTVAEVRDKSGKCRDCKYMDRCTGGCRNSALLQGDDYYAAVEENCYFFENGWEERITAVAQPAFEDYIKRREPREKAKEDEKQCL